MYEVLIPYDEVRSGMFGQRTYTSINGLFERIHDTYTVSDTFGDWLLEHCPSWATVYPKPRGRWSLLGKEIQGIILGFNDPGEAMIVKLTWGGQ